MGFIFLLFDASFLFKQLYKRCLNMFRVDNNYVLEDEDAM